MKLGEWMRKIWEISMKLNYSIERNIFKKIGGRTYRTQILESLKSWRFIEVSA